MMDEATERRFTAWCDHQNIGWRERGAMAREFNSDPEYWGKESYWKLYDRTCRD